MRIHNFTEKISFKLNPLTLKSTTADMLYAAKMPEVTYRCHQVLTQQWQPFRFQAFPEYTCNLISAPEG